MGKSDGCGLTLHEDIAPSSEGAGKDTMQFLLGVATVLIAETIALMIATAIIKRKLK